MGGHYVKLFGSILNSSVWCADASTRLVWITMLVLAADADGNVWGAVPGIARQAGVSVEDAHRAIEFLSSPDIYSRTPDLDGRRIVEIPGGWRIVNADKYRELQTDGQRKASVRAKRYRARKRHVTPRDDRDASRASRPEGEGEAEGDIPMDRLGREGEPPAPVSDEPRRFELADELVSKAAAVAAETGRTLETVLQRASLIPAGNGRPARSFADPRRPGISVAWIEATLRALPETAAALQGPPL